MFEEQELLISIIKKLLEEYKIELDELKEQSNSSIKKYDKEIKKLRDDFDYLIEVDLSVFEEILSESNKSEEEKSKLFNLIKLLKKLLELNKKENTTYVITDKQKDEFAKIFGIIREIEDKNKAEDKDSISTLKGDISKLKKLLGLLEDNNSSEFISDTSTITMIFDRLDLDEDTKRRILIGILKYNQMIYKNIISSKEIVLNIKRLNVEEVRELFTSHGYNFDELSDKLKENILNYGNIDNMGAVFDSLEANHFPKFDMKKMGRKLVAILINSSPETINKIVEFSRSKGIFPNDLLSIVPVLIEQTKGRKRKKTGSGGSDDNSPIISGKSEDYIQNIQFLELLGFDPLFIFNKCSEILLISHKKLVNNYRKFLSYKFTFSTNVTGDLTHPALSFLASSNFEEIIDQFIEISPLGYDYIKNNMSRATAISDPKSIIFYNIYGSYMDSISPDMTAEGPFVDPFSTKPRLRGEITRLSSDYRDIPYRGITEDNTQEITMTIDPEIKNKDQFDAAIEESKNEEDTDYVDLKDQRIDNLDEFIDPNNQLIYLFDGVRISRLKVKRIFSILKQKGLDNLEDSLLYAITYNSIINQEAFDKIKNIVKGRSL